MELIYAATNTTRISYSSFTPHDIPSLDHLLFLDKNHLINVLSRKCKKRGCNHSHYFYKSKRFKDGYESRCPVHSSLAESIKTGSFFADGKLLINKTMYIIHHLANHCGTTSIKGLIGIIDRKTITKVLTKLQILMKQFIFAKPPRFDETDWIEIDEMYIDWENPENKDETIKGKKGTWLLGIINRDRSKLWIEPISSRSIKEINRVLNKVLPADDCIIFTDALASYNSLDSKHCHFVINKKTTGFGRKSRRLIPTNTSRYNLRLREKYKDWVINVNVNMIENNWMLLRKVLTTRQAYRHPQYIINHVAEYMYKFYKYNWFDLLRIK